MSILLNTSQDLTRATAAGGGVAQSVYVGCYWFASAQLRVKVAFTLYFHRDCGVPDSRVEA
jgi:hypothetical protein